MKGDVITRETDQWGEHKVITQRNGIQVRLLEKPSQAYIDKMAAKAVIQAEADAAQKIIDDREKLIKDRMRQIAVDELTAEGKL